MDLHGADETAQLEEEFGETKESIAKNKPAGPFQIPFEIFIPKDLDGFLAAEKILSVTRLASGALRLQPITMLTGQAAGAIAAVAVKEEVPPREVNVLKVQRILLEAGDRLSLCVFSDVPPNHPLWPAVANGYRERLDEAKEFAPPLLPQGRTIITISCRHREGDAPRASLAWMSP